MSTKRFLLQKILQLFLTLFLVTAITFILMQLSPIDAAEAYSRRIFTVDETRIEAVREQMGLNRPIVVQYLDWLNDLLHFDLGNSYVDNRDVFLIVGSALKETACIVLCLLPKSSRVSLQKWELILRSMELSRCSGMPITWKASLT